MASINIKYFKKYKFDIKKNDVVINLGWVFNGSCFTDMTVKKAISHFLETVTYLKHRLKELILN